MTTAELDEWWASLTIAQKERIASKYVSKQSGIKMTCYYPNCSNVWNALSDLDKSIIHEHCVDNHGYLLPEYKEGKMMSE